MKKSNGFGPALIGALLGALLPALVAEAQTPGLTSLQVSATPAAAHAGESVQLHVLGFKADGTSVDVTSGAQGTLYSTAEPALQITADGLVAISQPAFRSTSSSYPAGIVVSNGSVAASILLAILPIDNDHDGMEDGYERAQGFDPTNPADAAEDADGDGLTNLQEFMMGTDPHNRDTDGDGVLDGFEAAHGGSPLDPHVQLSVGEQCTASALNRVVQVERGGGFSLNNVPTPQGRFRVRFVCNFPEGTVLAETPLTAPVPNGITSFPSVTLSTDARPLALTVTADRTALGSGGATAQLITLALLASGGQADLTAAATGTTYRSSNPGVATVSADGLVTAVASGTVLVTAINESVAGTVRLQVQLSGDADGDGIPDDYERANATNPGGNNLATLPGVQVNASSFSFGFPATQAVDGDLATSWLTSFGDSASAGQSPFIEVTFPANVGVAQVRLLGLNRQLPGHEIFAGIVQAFDASGNEIFNSGPVRLPTPFLDLRVPVDKDGVRRVRFTSTDDRCCTPGLAEFQVISRPGGPGFDPNNPADANADFDGDGLTNLQEFQLGTNPFSADTDGDGLTDAQELAMGTNPLVADTDGDGLTDGQEVAYGTNPLVADTDGDGLPDGVEVRLGLNPFLIDSNGNGIPDGSEDTDGDGLINLEEIQIHTDPGNPDTDGDGIPDGIDPFPLRPDQRPPTISITSPTAADRFTAGDTVILAAAASDDSGIAQVEFFVNGVSQGAVSTPPYRLTYVIPFGTTQIAVTAVATDLAGKTTSAGPVTISVAADPPPTVAILAPASGATIVAGSRLVVVVNATDNRAVAKVQLAVNGGDPLELTAPPYRFHLNVDPAATQLHLAATAFDNFGQTASATADFPVVPDPGTTAEGRVIDRNGQGVAGAAVRCDGVSGASGAGGGFSIPGVPTTSGAVSCIAVAGGATGISAVVAPVPGGTTQVGDVTIAVRLLYLGSGNGPGLRGRLMVLDEAANSLVPWGASIGPRGLAGIAFDAGGHLYAATIPAPASGGPVTDVVASRRAAASAAGGPGSHLLAIDPDTGAVLRTVGTVTEGAGGPAIGVQSLVFLRETGLLYAVGASGAAQGGLFAIDPATAVAHRVANGFPSSVVGPAAGADGLLDLLADFGGSLRLLQVDPVDGAVVASDAIAGTVGAIGGNAMGGMALRLDTATFLLSSAHDGAALYDLDLVRHTVTEIGTPGGQLDGQLLGLAYRPLLTPPVATTITGNVVDTNGQPLADVPVITLGGAAVTGADGSFQIPAVTVETARARAAASLGGDFAFSAAVPPVAGGTTDVGTIAEQAFTCVTGTLISNSCLRGPVTTALDLFSVDPLGDTTPAGQVFPDLSGHFCAMLRRDLVYMVRRDDFQCFCGRTTPCHASLQVTDPNASGQCTDVSPACQDLGTVGLTCDFFCGS